MIYEGIDRWNSPYIEHHGVKGMKWGVRRDRNASSNIAKAKFAYGNRKEAKFRYDNAFDDWYNFNSNHSSLFKRNRQESSRRLNRLSRTANAYDKANKAYKQANKQALNYKPYNSIKEAVQESLWSTSAANVWTTSYKAAKGKKGIINKGKAFMNSYLNTPYRMPTLTGTYNTTVKRNFTGRW